ncbi:hypothetical protein SynMVIR181_00624 [Synechococcus sp. MVIR-18-1]|nr:hypothetical protein SynMVIR181_00624 [Synechococcus sp. MVIR-18-1]
MELVGKNVISCEFRNGYGDRDVYKFEVNGKHVSKSIAEQFLDGTFN